LERFQQAFHLYQTRLHVTLRASLLDK